MADETETRLSAKQKGKMAARKKKKDKGKNKTPNAKTASTEENIASAGQISDAALDKGRQIADEFAPASSIPTTPEMQAFLNQLLQVFQQGQQYTGREEQALGALEAGLSGFTPQEMTAIREGQQEEVNRQRMANERAILEQGARQRLRGAAAGAAQRNLGFQTQQQMGNLEQQLLVQNAQEAQKRKEAFGSLVGLTERNRADRTGAFGSLYGGALSQEEMARMIREQSRGGTALAGAGMFAGLIGGQEALDLQKKNAEDSRRLNEQLIKIAQQNANRTYSAPATTTSVAA